MISAGVSRRRVLAAGLGGVLLAGCGEDAGPVRRLRLATGPEGGPYNAFGRALATAVAERAPRLRITPVSTSASVDNLRMLDDGSVELALAVADAAQDAVVGREPFDRPQWRVLLREVTAGARLAPRFAISTGEVPLRPGAVAYYRSVYD